MKSTEITPGMKVCTTHKGSAFCNTTVVAYPVEGWPGHAWLDGVDEPYPIAELKPFTTGLAKSGEFKTSIKN